MLLITDRGGDRAGRWQDGLVVRLGEPLAPVADVSPIVCDVALDDTASLHALREVLARLRPSPTVPVHFILRDTGLVAHALANALGATSISVEPESCAVPATLVRASPPAAPKPEERVTVEGDVTVVAAGLSRIFDAAVARTPVAQRDLDDSVVALLRSTKEAGIGRWVEIVRRYDDATYQHCLLVAGLTAGFATRLGLSIARQRMLVKAALLHDIGKARVPREILNKPGALTAAELALMRRHPSDGYYMLVRQGDLEPGVLDIVLHHHEMLDGSGYPDGLRREQISDVVRIVTICDIHAALIERRPYREPMTVEDAYGVLLGMGGKLDATLLAAFAGLIAAMGESEPRAELRASA